MGRLCSCADYVQDLAVNEADDPDHRALKQRVLEVYNWKLNERQRRKEFVLERGLLDYKKQVC